MGSPKYPSIHFSQRDPVLQQKCGNYMIVSILLVSNKIKIKVHLPTGHSRQMGLSGLEGTSKQAPPSGI